MVLGLFKKKERKKEKDGIELQGKNPGSVFYPSSGNPHHGEAQQMLFTLLLSVYVYTTSVSMTRITRHEWKPHAVWADATL